jgi:lipopolysaccharide export system protein LptC
MGEAMRNQRVAHRYRLSIGMVLALFAALGSFWLVELLNRSGDEMQAGIKIDEPDYIVEGFSFVRMTKTGQPSYIISGDRLTHHPADDSSDIDKPVDQDNTRVMLTEKVRIHRAAQAGSQEMRLNSEALTVFPDEDRIETDQPVQVQVGGATATGTGLRANNATGQINLAGRGTLVVPPRAK